MMAKKRDRKLSPANLEIMKVVWEKGEVTINEVVAVINARRKNKIRRTTVQVQMNRLEDYGWLKHTERGRTYVYTADEKLRNLFRSTAYHNVIAVDQEEMNRIEEGELFYLHEDAKPKVNLFEVEKSFDYLDAQHSGYQRQVHAKSVKYFPVHPGFR